jgi:hypothetical protein
VVIETDRPLKTFTPGSALGAAIDGTQRGEVALYLTPFNIEKMRSAGLRRVSYRLRPELGVEAWHWTEEGSWSDPARAQGYWTGSDDPHDEGPVTWGYSLPRRGDTVDQANNQGYSRLDDGDPATFWKSNPYLDPRYTGAADARPQWIVVSLPARRPIDAARILWGAPFARHFQAQYWSGDDRYDSDGRWVTFPRGDRTIAGAPDEAVLRLAPTPIRARYLRILLLTSSGTAPPGARDPRDSLGYAVREVGFGLLDAGGAFQDAVRHGPSRESQTPIQVSSTDPWHRASDRDLNLEQPSLALMFRSGLAGEAPMMVPAGVLYDTPENAAAELRYLRRRGFPVREMELGEEPDGQAVSPEDYADLYLETALALHRIDPALTLGGPSLQAASTDTWPDPEAGDSWSGRFIARLRARGGLGELGFFSFEHYAFDTVCRPAGELLRDETDLMRAEMADITAQGAPGDLPRVISEYGFSAFAGRDMSDIPSALLAADIVGQFLALGGDAAFMFGYPPNLPTNQDFPCAGYGDMMLFQAGDDGQARWPMPSYYAERMMTQDWGAPADQPHQLYAARSQDLDAKGRALVTAYPLRDANGGWSVMLVNRDEARAHRLRIALREPGRTRALGAVSVVQYSPEQYAWLDRGPDSHPVRDLPPRRYQADGAAPLRLPALSLTVIRELGPASPSWGGTADAARRQGGDVRHAPERQAAGAGARLQTSPP